MLATQAGIQRTELSADINHKVTRSRVLMIVLAIGALVGAVVSLRTPAGSGRVSSPQRGGQLVGSIRSEPRSFNRFVSRDPIVDIVSLLTQGRLVQINRATFELEPVLAERWEESPDGRTYTVHLRPGVTWSDGVPFTSADVLFSLEALFTPKSGAILGSSLMVADEPITATAPDETTVVFTYPAPSGPGLALLDNLWILPKHKLEPALRAGTLASTWDTKTAPSEVVGTGPFSLAEYQPGQRLVFTRNPRYWRKAEDGGTLPYLDRIVLEIVPDQNAEILRLSSGNIDLTMTELRPDDYAPVRRAADQGRLRLLDLGVGPDPDAFWFCLKPEAKRGDPRFAFVQRPEFRRAISHAVDREQFAETVFLGAAVPVWGPVTPGNKPWFSPNVPRYPHSLTRAKEILNGLGLQDRDGNGIVEDAKGTEARFTMITQRGNTALERGSAALRDELAKVGIALEVAPLELGAMIDRMLNANYDAIYYRPLFTALDPALNKDYWLSSGSGHFWNFAQKTPATDWEREIDTLMLQQASTIDPERRRALFNDVQRIFAENLPVIYFVAPRLYYAHSTRVTGGQPSVLRPQLLWRPETLSVTAEATTH
jgi:peptide/nickel transport system substrate-binding protein